MSPERRTFELGEAFVDERVDRLVAMLVDCSRAEAAALVVDGAVSVDGASVVTKSARLERPGVLRVVVPEARESGPVGDDSVEVPIVYVDDDVIVVDKPAGLVVHPAPGHRTGTLVNGLLAQFEELAEVGEPERPGIVHRLDRETSGLMVVARTDEAYESLVTDLALHDVERRYRSLVHGTPDAASGTIDAPVGRSRRDRTRMAVAESGRHAVTHYSVSARCHDPDVSLLDLQLETGRTHQIRVHLRAIGCPVVGDTTYGRPLTGTSFSRPFLHAVELAFRHPSTGDEVRFTSPLAPDLGELLRSIGLPETEEPRPS